MQFQKRQVGYWSALLVVIVLISLIIVYLEGNSNMAVYKADDQNNETAAVTAPPVSLDMYTHTVLGFTYGIPKEWIRVTKGGYDTYIHSPSATSLQIQTGAYDPRLTTVSTESLASELSGYNCELLSFGWVDNSTFSSIYRKPTETGPYLYVELTSFDRSNMVRLVFAITEEYYERLDDTIIAMIDAFSWNKQSPFPENTYVFYNSFGNFEFVYPSGWNHGVQDNAFVAQDPTSGAVMSVVVSESMSTYEGFSQLDYVNWANTQRTGLAVSHYAADANKIYAVSSYNNTGVSMVLIQLLVASGTYEYMITIEIPYDNYMSMMELIEDLINAFRYFE